MADDTTNDFEEVESEEYEEEEYASEEESLEEENWDLPGEAPFDMDNFDFVEAYSDEPSVDERMLAENSAPSAINCAFVGCGGGGGKMAKAFLDLGFNKTLLINTTEKDQPDGVDGENFLLIPGADGVAKDIKLGKQVLGDNSTLVEDALRTRIGKVDWIFVLAGGGGGTGSACHVLHKAMTRYLSSIEAGGKVVYIASKPTAQELLNPTIKNNYEAL
jgi:cell division GTPase FtsZ